MSMVGDNGGTYAGTFEFRQWLTPDQEVAADREYRDRLGPNSPAMASDRAEGLAFALAQLRQRVVAAPPFWGLGSASPGGSVADKEVVTEAMSAAAEAELAHRREVRARRAEALGKLKEAAERRARELAEVAVAEEEAPAAPGEEKPGAP